jgi:putative SOS response-associated peptidase YedK
MGPARKAARPSGAFASRARSGFASQAWDRAHTADGEIESYALVTLPPSRAFEKYHDRQPLIPQREDYTASLDSPAAAKELFAASRPDDLLIVEKAIV